MPTFTQDFPEFRNMDSGNESVNRIRRNYATKDAERARAARRRMQEGVRRETVEAQNDGQMREWEARRRARDVRLRGRSESRELIDGRGSIDSRAFNERREIVGYTIDERDRHEPMLDIPDSPSRWRSHDGYSVNRQRISSSRGGRSPRPAQVGLQGGAMGRKRDFAASSKAGVPLFVKVAIPVIIVLIVILVFLLTP